MVTRDVVVGRWRVSHQIIHLCLLLLPIWALGAGDLVRFAWKSTPPGFMERNGFVKGRDFVQFYVAGTLAREGDWEALYDVGRLEKAIVRVVPAAAGQIPAPLYGPQVALFFVPWSKLSYLDARWAWCAFSVLMYAIAVALVMRTAAPILQYRRLAWLTIFFNPALAMLLATGQTSALAVLAWSLATVALINGRQVVFGLCLGLLAYKPSLLVGALPVLLIVADATALAGVALSVVGQWSLAVLVTGIEPWQAYLRVVLDPSRYYFLTDTLPHQKQSIFGFFQLLLGSGPAATILWLGSSAVILSLWWRHRDDRRVQWFLPMLATTSVLLSPHLYVYDLAVLVPALLVVADTLSRRCESRDDRALAWVGYAVLFAPWSGAFASRSRVQLSTILLLILLLAIHRKWSSDRAGREHIRS